MLAVCLKKNHGELLEWSCCSLRIQLLVVLLTVITWSYYVTSLVIEHFISCLSSSLAVSFEFLENLKEIRPTWASILALVSAVSCCCSRCMCDVAMWVCWICWSRRCLYSWSLCCDVKVSVFNSMEGDFIGELYPEILYKERKHDWNQRSEVSTITA